MSWLDRILFRGKKRPGQWRPVQESKGDVAVGDGAVLNVSSNSYRSLIRAAVSDAERIAADITDKARSDASAEAERVLARARLEAAELKEKAEAGAREEAQNIISDAEKTADGIEIEAKKRAVQFLVQQSQFIEKEIAREYSLALAKLSANLQSLSADSDKINFQLKHKMAMLAANKSLALNEAMTALLGTAEAETPSEKEKKSTSALATSTNRTAAGRQQQADKKGKKYSRKKLPPLEIPPEPVLPTRAADFELEEAIPATTPEPAITVAEEPAAVAAEPPKKQRKFFSFGVSFTGKKEKPSGNVPGKKPGPPAAVKTEPEPAAAAAPPEPAGAPPEPARPPAATVSPEAPTEPVNPPAAAVPAEAPTTEPVAPAKLEPAESSVVSQTEVEPPTLLDVDTQTQYSGEVELMIVPPVDLKLVSHFYNYLQTIPELKVLYTRGSWDQGTTIVVVLEKPFTLVKTITAIPNISVSVGVLEKDAAAGGKTISLLRRKDRSAKRLGLILKEAVAAPKA